MTCRNASHYKEHLQKYIGVNVAKSLGSNSRELYASEPDSVFCLVCVLGLLPKTGKSAIIYNTTSQQNGPLSSPIAHILLLVLTELLSDSFSKMWLFEVHNSPHT